MPKKRILLVDDDKDILRMLEYGLKKLSADFQIATARDSASAMDQVENQQFDMVLTDYMMPGITGIDLARAVRRISPETKVVLMTAFGTSRLRDTTDLLGFDGYLNKPFDINQIRKIVQGIEEDPDQIGEQEKPPAETSAQPETSPVSAQSINDHLQKLQANAGLRCVLLINSHDESVQVVGQIDHSKITKISTLATINFLGAAELAGLLDNRKPFKSTFYEGDDYNIYMCDVNGKYLLAVVFDARLRPGVVWFYTKQTVNILIPLLD